MKYIIIGGVAGGATAAARIRRNDENGEIILIEKGEYISYANCGLPYYIGGVIDNREKLFVQTPATFGKRFNIDVRVKNEAIRIDTAHHTIAIRQSDGVVYNETYDKLLLSPGASPVKPPLEGIDNEGIFTLRNVKDTDHIKNFISNKKIKRAVIVGAGFIGLEMAENLHNAGIEVSIVEMANQVMSPLDYSMAAYVQQELLQKGVKLYLEKSVSGFRKIDEQLQVMLKSGETIDTDMVLLSIGVRAETTLAKTADVKIGEAGGIWVDEYLQTSVQDIYAVGDAIEFPHPVTHKPWLNFLANPANRQARIVADNMVFGHNTTYEGAIGTAIAKVFDMTVASTGLAAKRLKQMDINYCSSVTHSASHAGYYPGAMPMTIKITFDPQSGRLFGAQCIGHEGVDKRIDQISVIIKNEGTIYDLMKLEQTYAPPFSSAKDPVAIAGYVAGNIINGTMPVITWRDFRKADLSDAMLIDTRTQEEYSFGAIGGAVNIPLDELREHLDEIPRDKTIYVYCAVGLRGYLAQRILMGRGYKNVFNISGGYKTYSTAIAALKYLENQNNISIPDNNLKQSLHTSGDGQSELTYTGTIHKIDACGLQCPGPVMKMKKTIDSITEGERIQITATDAGFARDAEAWCRTTGNKLISSSSSKGQYTVVIEKEKSETCPVSKISGNKAKTFIMFSDDLDKALATFVLANGALATGQKVTIFFTFWGLNVIKKIQKPKVRKDIFGKMFGMMLPSDSQRLHLSKMSMFGIGDKMMRYIMKKKNIESLETLRQHAIDNNVEFIACQMSMDVMGIQREELLDNVTIGGVATYMERAEQANVNLFI